MQSLSLTVYTGGILPLKIAVVNSQDTRNANAKSGLRVRIQG